MFTASLLTVHARICFFGRIPVGTTKFGPFPPTVAWTSADGQNQRLALRVQGRKLYVDGDQSESGALLVGIQAGSDPRWAAVQVLVNQSVVSVLVDGVQQAQKSLTGVASRSSSDVVSLGCNAAQCSTTGLRFAVYVPATDVRIGRLVAGLIPALDLRAMQSAAPNVQQLRDRTLYFDGSSAYLQTPTLPTFQGAFTLSLRRKSGRLTMH